MNEPKLRVGIVDDEFLARQTLINYIARYCSNVEVVFQAADLPKAVSQIKLHKPQAVFLDIEMPGPSGMEIAKHLSEAERPLVVFTTAYAEYAVDAFGIRAIDYLLKPIEVTRLREAVSRLRGQLAEKNAEHEETISIPTSNGVKLLPVSEVLFLKADGSYTEIRTEKNENHVVSRKLFELEEKLSPKSFLRTHRSYIVNVEQVREYVGGKNSELLLSTGKSVPVSRSKKEAVKKILATD